MVFDFYSDFRTAPVIREDSWIGEETKGHNFDAPIEVVNRSTLVLDTEITVSQKLLISPGSTVHINPDGVLVLDSTECNGSSPGLNAYSHRRRYPGIKWPYFSFSKSQTDSQRKWAHSIDVGRKLNCLR